MDQSKNDVTIKSLLDEDVKQTVHVDRLRAYHGGYEQAVDLSRAEQGESLAGRGANFGRGDVA